MMDKINVIFCIIFLTTTVSFSQKEMIHLNGIEVEEFLPPNMVRIDTNFYADKTEVTNMFYKEYLYWLKTTYGTLASEFIDAIPDLSVWTFQPYFELDGQTYLEDPEFNDFPVVGVTLEQAKAYSEWRTDRVAEMLLIELGYLKPIKESTPENYFSLEKLKAGTIALLKPLDSNFIYPLFYIPTSKEWDKIAAINEGYLYGVDPRDSNNKKLVENGYLLIHTQEALDESKEQLYSPTQSVVHGCINKNGLYHTLGNVSEMVDQPGIAKGGDWMHLFKDINFRSNVEQNIPNCWTGFRNVSRLEIMSTTN
ncbi:MAG: SUMF1/EgtB/PvdO family nonheme iron enzyme [Saprospiraceae bacterium]|nr:SUMF1/EgtB/PvdO family nonheme iron enzyme [Saprospiraceae bacterium]